MSPHQHMSAAIFAAADAIRRLEHDRDRAVAGGDARELHRCDISLAAARSHHRALGLGLSRLSESYRNLGR
jgi:hypothetical protein